MATSMISMLRLAPAFLAFMLSATAAKAEADGPDFWAVSGVTADDVLVVRAKPHASARKVGDVPPDGRRLQNLGCTGVPTFAESQKMTAAQRKRAAAKRWCRIKYKGMTGWVYGKFLREDGA